MQPTVRGQAPWSTVLLRRLLSTQALVGLLPRQGVEGEETKRRSKRQRGKLIKMSALEPHYSPRQVAEMWGWSVKTVIRRFRGEPGVLKAERPETRSKRRYTRISIPESVLLRVHERLEVRK